MPQNIRAGLSGNALKIFAMVFMTMDHVGMVLFPQQIWLRMAGRVAMPIYAFMLAEGSRYTRHPLRRLGMIAGLAAVCQLVYWAAQRSLYQCILVTFTLSLLIILTVETAQKRRSRLWGLLSLAVMAGAWFLCERMPALVPGFEVDYGFWGVLLPVAVRFSRNPAQRLAAAAVVLLLLARDSGFLQYYSFIALPFLAAYQGQRGRWNLKYVFYFYYPIHLAVIHLVDILRP